MLQIQHIIKTGPSARIKISTKFGPEKIGVSVDEIIYVHEHIEKEVLLFTPIKLPPKGFTKIRTTKAQLQGNRDLRILYATIPKKWREEHMDTDYARVYYTKIGVFAKAYTGVTYADYQFI